MTKNDGNMCVAPPYCDLANNKCHFWVNPDNAQSVVDALNEAIAFINRPSAEFAAIKRGKWLRSCDNRSMIKCSICGREINTFGHEQKEFCGCPHCGARMILEVEEL